MTLVVLKISAQEAGGFCVNGVFSRRSDAAVAVGVAAAVTNVDAGAPSDSDADTDALAEMPEEDVERDMTRKETWRLRGEVAEVRSVSALVSDHNGARRQNEVWEETRTPCGARGIGMGWCYLKAMPT